MVRLFRSVVTFSHNAAQSQWISKAVVSRRRSEPGGSLFCKSTRMVLVFPAGAPTSVATRFHEPSGSCASIVGKGNGRVGSSEAATLAIPPPKRSQPVMTRTRGRSTGSGPKSIVTEKGSARPRSCGWRKRIGETILPSMRANASVTSKPSLRVACRSGATGRNVQSSCGGKGLLARILLVG